MIRASACPFALLTIAAAAAIGTAGCGDEAPGFVGETTFGTTATPGEGSDSTTGSTPTSSTDPSPSDPDEGSGSMCGSTTCPAEAPLCIAGICTPCFAVEDPDSACAERNPDTPFCYLGECVTCSLTDGPNESCSEATPDTPFCVQGRCTGCDATVSPNGACETLGDGSLPVCVGSTCVQCASAQTTACVGATPICDAEVNACVGCTNHDQCPGSACHIRQGNCFTLERVWFVDGDAETCESADGTNNAPYCTIDDALMMISSGQQGVIILNELDEGLAYQQHVEVAAGRTLAILAAPGNRPELTFSAGSSTVELSGSANTLYLDGIRLSANTAAPAVEISGGAAYFDATEVVQNNAGGIVLTDGAYLQLRNSVLGRNGNPFASTRGLSVQESNFDLLYTTIAANDGEDPNISIECDAGSEGTARNSIVVGTGTPSILCSGLRVTQSAVDTEGLTTREVVEVVGFDATWFVDVAGGDFHLSRPASTPFIDIAIWRAGDPAVDLDGDPRPSTDGDPDYAGADRP